MKFYEVKLSEKGLKVKIPTGNPATPLIEAEQRETEVDILSNLFDFAASNTKKLSEMNLCLDCQAQLDLLRTSEGNFRMTKSDYDLLLAGLEQSAGKRPFVWHKVPALFKSIEKPEELNIDVNKG